MVVATEVHPVLRSCNRRFSKGSAKISCLRYFPLLLNVTRMGKITNRYTSGYLHALTPLTRTYMHQQCTWAVKCINLELERSGMTLCYVVCFFLLLLLKIVAMDQKILLQGILNSGFTE